MSEKLRNEKISKLLILYSIPAIVGMVVSILYNLVDRFFIGQWIGRLGIAGVSITMPISTFILSVGLLVGIGSGVLISINLGRNDKKSAEEIIGNTISLLVLGGVIVSVITFLFMDKILFFMGATPETLPFARDYLYYLTLGLTFQIIFIGLNESIIGSGFPKKAMIISFIGCGMNIILDPIFIKFFGLGIKGAAIATSISNIAATTAQIYYFTKGSSVIKIKLKNMKLRLDKIKDISNIGIAPFIMQASNCAIIIFINQALKTYGGNINIAAYGIISSLNLLFFLPIVGIYQGSQPILGFNYGASLFERVRKTYILSLIVSVVISCIGFILIFSIPDILVSPFIKNDDELRILTIESAQIFFAMLFCLGFNLIGSSYFQSIGRPKITTFLNIFKQFILMIPLLIFLPSRMGLKGVWIATPIAELLTALVTGYYVYKEFKKLNVTNNI